MKKEKNIKILVVEDEDLIRKAYVDELIDEGFKVFSANNGEEGLATALKEEPDLILLDVLMPVMDGLAMMEKLRAANQYGKDVHIIMLTNLSATEERIVESVAKNEPAYYLIKSDWELSKVLEKIREVLSSKVTLL